jgi:tetratricopeptide (TPR) repeat protein
MDSWYGLPNATNMLKKMLILLLVGCLLYGIYVAGRMGVADVFAGLGTEEILSWDERGERIDYSSWVIAERHYLSALDLVPDHPDYLYNLGRLYYLNARLFQVAGEDTQLLIRAQEFLKKAINLRPAWPLAWAHLALVKAQMRDYSKAYLVAMERAVTLGPWEPGVHVAVTSAGFSGWLELEAGHRRMVVDNAVRGVMSHSPGQSGRMIRLLHSLNRGPLICPYLPREDYFQKLCIPKNNVSRDDVD